jgi:hypothetical protein
MVRDYFTYPYNPLNNRTMRMYRDLIDSAFRGFDDSEKLKETETATITMRKNGKIYQIQIKDITSQMENKDEVISVEVKQDSQFNPKGKKDEDKYYSEYTE